MDILQDLNKLYNSWDASGGYGTDNYEKALYKCINELGDLIIKHENKPPNYINSPDALCKECNTIGRNGEHSWYCRKCGEKI